MEKVKWRHSSNLFENLTEFSDLKIKLKNSKNKIPLKTDLHKLQIMQTGTEFPT